MSRRALFDDDPVWQNMPLVVRGLIALRVSGISFIKALVVLSFPIHEMDALSTLGAVTLSDTPISPHEYRGGRVSIPGISLHEMIRATPPPPHLTVKEGTT